MCCADANVDGRDVLIELFLLVLLGSSLLIFAEEKEWQVYVKLVLYLILSSAVLSFFA